MAKPIDPRARRFTVLGEDAEGDVFALHTDHRERAEHMETLMQQNHPAVELVDQEAAPGLLFVRSEQGNAVLIRGTERIVLGPAESVGEEMCRFLAEIDFGECG